MDTGPHHRHIGRRHLLIASAALVVAVMLATAASALPQRAAAHTTSASTGAVASKPSPLTFIHVKNGDIQAILDAHPHETVVIDGMGYGPETPIPGSGACAQAPAQSATFDRTRLSAAELDYYGLPPRPTGAAATPDRMATWESVVRSQRHRVCTSRSVFDPQTGQALIAQTDGIYAGNIDTWYTAQFTDVYAAWDTPCLASGQVSGFSVVWTGIGARGVNLKQGGTEQNIVDWYGDTSYYVWTENYPSQGQNYHFDVNCGDNIYSETYGSNCAYVQDYNNGHSVRDCSGPTATNGDADFIVERPGSRLFGPGPLANFQSVDLYETYTNYGRGDTLSHIGYWMVNNGKACASPGPWNYGSFTVTWQGYCE